MNADSLSVVQAAAIEAADGPGWLVEGLWAEEGVGIVGGAPKSGKSWLALDLAVSVATGTEALGHYPVPRSGPVLLYAAEDPPQTVRSRLAGLALDRGLALDQMPVYVVMAPSLRLDLPTDQARLLAAVERYRPRLLVLDPFVRLHRIDENSALEVSGVLAYLRDLQRSLQVAVLVVHHSRKAGSDTAGLSLRGSGDFHAWGDSNLYLRRRRGALELAIEHRSAASPQPVQLALVCEEGRPAHLAVVRAAGPLDRALDDLKGRLVEILAGAQGPVTQETARVALRVRMQRLVEALRDLEREGRVRRSAAGWTAVPAPLDGDEDRAQPALFDEAPTKATG